MTPYFDEVIATDASAEQISSADPRQGLTLRVAPAEESGLETESADLVTVAQALHWFDVDRFFAEAIRVLKPGGVLSFWCYEHSQVNPACDEIIRKIFAEVDAYWPPEREIVEGRYESIVSPLPEFAPERFSMEVTWTADDALEYMRTWSATRRYIDDKDADPMAIFADELHAAWGDGRRLVHWPITLRVCRK